MRHATRSGGLVLAVLSFALMAGQLSGQTSVGEAFAYEPTGADVLGQNGGAGFAGPWFASGFYASIHDSYDVAAGSLGFGDLVFRGNRLQSAPTGAIAGLGRNFAAPISAGATTTVYLSLLLRPEGALG
jgi:hypothetical protein